MHQTVARFIVSSILTFFECGAYRPRCRSPQIYKCIFGFTPRFETFAVTHCLFDNFAFARFLLLLNVATALTTYFCRQNLRLSFVAPFPRKYQVFSRALTRFTVVFSRARLWRDVSPAQDEARSEAEDARSIFEASDSAGAMHYFRKKVRFEKT